MKQAFVQMLGADAVVDDRVRMAAYLNDWRGHPAGQTPFVLLPRTAQQVAAIVRHCAERRIALTTQGGNSGLVGGQTPRGEVLLSLRRLNAIRHQDTVGASLTVEAGMTLATVQETARQMDLRFPLDLAARDSATVGGLIATNAGGVQVLRFGMMRAQVLGLEAVLPDGTLWDNLSPLHKNNTGLDLKHLLIGTEGTLGVVTAAALRLVPPAQSVATALVAVGSIEEALALLQSAQKALGAGLEAFEIIPRLGIEFVCRHIPDMQTPFAVLPPWTVLVEATSQGTDAATQIEHWLTGLLAHEQITDAVLAQSLSQRAAFWALREHMSAAQKSEGVSLKHDIALPIARLPVFLATVLPGVQRLAPGCRPVPFGHLGDGNLHFNISQPVGADGAAFAAQADAVADLVYTQVIRFGGSISAEHGIGTVKTAWAERLLPPAQIAAYRAIRTALDPNRILNPRVLF